MRMGWCRRAHAKGSIHGLGLWLTITETATLRHINLWTYSQGTWGQVGQIGLYKCGMGTGEGLGYFRKLWLYPLKGRAGKDSETEAEDDSTRWRSLEVLLR